ncbi:hypothetical protein LTR12_010731 [Friedmanniomyces endolithicus]|nr:hypothetical protein LTR12_010731 [Friedmanniomyces endolithicus]
MATFASQGSASAGAAPSGNSRILSNFIHAILRDNGDKLDVLEEVASMLGDVQPLMQHNIRDQIASLGRGPQACVNKDNLHRAITGKVASQHAMDSLLANTRARTFLAVIKMMNAQQWPVEQVDEPEDIRYAPSAPRRASSSLMTQDAQATMLNSLLGAVGSVMEEVANILAAKTRLRRTSARPQQGQPSVHTAAPVATSIQAPASNTSSKGQSRAVEGPESSQRSRAQAVNAPWTAKETLAVAVAWWDGNLEQDAAKRQGHGTAARVDQHNQWIRTHGTELQVKPGDRSWDALDQWVRNLKKAGTTLAEIQAQAAEEEQKAGQQ